MKTFLRVLVGVAIALLVGGCVVPQLPTQSGTDSPNKPGPGLAVTPIATSIFTAEPTVTPVPTIAPGSKSTMVAAHLQKSQEYRKNRDFKAALGEVEQAERLITDKSLNNQEYISVLLHKADVYAYFERLDEAETTLLQATGIPDDKINALTNSRQLITKEQYLTIANELQELVVQDNRSGYHVALSFIYNILGDTQRLQVEQQRAMDVSTTKDTTPAVALGLYKIRQRKLEVHAALEQQKGLAQAEPEKLDLQLQLGYAYYLAGWFAEAQEIADKYMTQVDREKDKDLYILLLSLKMNLAMAQGRYDEMKQYERGILEVDPHALDRFK